MKGNERRENIIKILSGRQEAVSGKALADQFGVSRQVIVQDIALLRAQKYEIVSTTLGYILHQEPKSSRVFKVQHTDEQTEQELNLIVDYGGTVEDVFVYHKVYGVIRADLHIRSRADVAAYLAELATGKSSYLKNVTSGFHYHTVTAPTETILDLIQTRLEEAGFLARLQEFEPVDFWKEDEADGKS